MKSITIHNLDSKTAELIERKSRETGLSQNKTIKKLLQLALGISPGNEDQRNEFKEFLGVWENSDFEYFQKSVKEFNQVDMEDWQ